jgi:hypothetical protein
MNETELADWCRNRGLFVEEVRRRREACAEANEIDRVDGRKLREELKTERLKIKDLEKDLRRKERALAETSALLVLRKKAAAIWGDGGED